MTQASDTQAKVLAIVCEQLKKDKESLQLDALLADQGADEFDIIEMAMRYEEQFSMIIPDSDFSDLQTITQATQYITKHK